MFSGLGNSKCKVLFVLGLKDAFHSLRLSEDSKKYCGILTYFGSASYMYQRMPMGLNISPSIWQSYINAILECLPSRKHCKVIMDDFITIHTFKESTHGYVRRFIKGLTKNGLKISPKKCQLFKTELQSCSKLVISVTEHLVKVGDKLSTASVVFFRSERILKCMCLYGA